MDATASDPELHSFVSAALDAVGGDSMMAEGVAVPFADVEVDSLAATELCLLVEERTGRCIPDFAFQEILTLRCAVDWYLQLRGPSGDRAGDRSDDLLKDR